MRERNPIGEQQQHVAHIEAYRLDGDASCPARRAQDERRPSEAPGRPAAVALRGDVAHSGNGQVSGLVQARGDHDRAAGAGEQAVALDHHGIGSGLAGGHEQARRPHGRVTGGVSVPEPVDDADPERIGRSREARVVAAHSLARIGTTKDAHAGSARAGRLELASPDAGALPQPYVDVHLVAQLEHGRQACAQAARARRSTLERPRHVGNTGPAVGRHDLDAHLEPREGSRGRR